MRKIAIYVAGRTSFIKKHNDLRKYLESNLNCEVCLPHELVPSDTSKDKIPTEAFTKCVKYMNMADIIIADIDIYGKDTAWEIGYLYGTEKKVIGLAGNERYKFDFMVRGALTCIAKKKEELVKIIEREVRI
jgi:nucleoside 2-deoxyribosyltransferase